MDKLIYCAKTDCENNIKGCCDAELISINEEGLCDSFIKKEIEPYKDPDKERI